MTTSLNFVKALLALTLLQLCALASANANWDVKVTMVGRGIVECRTFDSGEEPGPSKVFKESGKLVVEEGFDVIMTFTPDDGYRLERVMDNGVEVRVAGISLPAAYRFQIFENHHIVVQFVIDSPIGNFDLSYKDGTSATPIVDVTGTYTGVIPDKEKPYTADVAMDESGKIAVLGSVAGFVNRDGTSEVELAGSMKTRNDTPTASGNASAAGMLDGVPVSIEGKAKGPVEVTDGVGGPEIQGVVASATGKEGEERFTEEPQVVTVPAQPANIDKSWNLALTLAEKTNAQGRKYVVASATLNLPNGDKTRFAEKRVAYSLKRGYSINFVDGVKLDSLGDPILNTKGKPVIDRKSIIAISKMLLEQTGGVWEPTAGLLKYKFLGQKGDGNVLDFL